MKTEQLALVQGMADTKAALRRWNAQPSSVLLPWAAGSLAIALLLLIATAVIAHLSEPDSTPLHIVGLTEAASTYDYGYILIRNGLVLALHSLACLAGFIAGSAMPTVAEGHSGRWRKVHEAAGPMAIGFVICATGFSLFTQAFVLGGDAATIAAQLGLSPVELLAVLSIHAVPELFALFLPLAAWSVASRKGRWEDLLAATIVTTLIAIPIILGAAAVETWVTPRILAGLI